MASAEETRGRRREKNGDSPGDRSKHRLIASVVGRKGVRRAVLALAIEQKAIKQLKKSRERMTGRKQQQRD
jgi:hypothetical protein